MEKITFRKSVLLLFALSLISLSARSATLYWVGGSGEWHNTSHWSITSGGHSGANVPSSNDDVVFDQNSFSNNNNVVFSGKMECHSMTWNSDIQRPTVSGGINSSLYIYGSFILSQQINWNYGGEINFKSTQTGNTINTRGKLLPGNVTIDGSGSWQMAGSLILSPSATLTFNSGSITTNGNAIQCGILKIAGADYKMLDFNNSILAIKQEYNDAGAANFHSNSSNSKIYIQNSLPVNSFENIHNHNIPHNLNSHVTPDVTSVDSVIINPTCNGADTGNSCNGAIIIRKINSTDNGPYSISWAGPKLGLDTVTADSVFGLCPNTYSYTIYDSASQTVYGPIFVTITAPPPLTTNYIKREVKCHGDCDGWIITRISGETPNYTYRWSNGISGIAIGDPSNSFIDSGLCAGTYAIRIKDSNGCVNTFKTNITQPLPVTISFATTNVSCNGDCNGKIIATVSGGHGNYTYLWSPGGQTTATISSLCPGTYSLTAKDDSGCIGSGTATITQPPALVISVSKTNVSCNGNCNGSATATVSGGTPVYTYKWNTGATTSSISGLCAGNYKIVVTDAHGCKDSANVSITQPLTITINVNQTNVSCNGDCNGKASVTITGGTPVYTYKWSTGATTSSISALCPGVYKIVVTDSNHCKDSLNVTITQPAPIVITMSQTNLTCNGTCNGTATATVSGGTPVYTYKWSNGATTSSITSLCAGAYKVVVTDKNGCKDSASVTITQPAGMIITTTNTKVNCSGNCIGTATVSVSGGTAPYTYKWSTGATTTNVSNLCAGVYKIVVTDAHGCKDSANVNITTPNPLVLTPSQTNIKCKGDCNGSATVTVTGGTPVYTYKWNTGATTSSISGLCAGVYKIVVKDSNGCKDSLNITITQPALALTVTTTQTNVSCNGSCNGTATATITGGTPVYTYKWNNGATTSSISGLCAGIYKIVVKDSNGCKDSATVTITQPSALSISITQTNVNCTGNCIGTATATVSGGTPVYVYKWSTGATTSSISGLCAGVYKVVVTDSHGCKDSVNVTITSPTPLVITITQSNIKCKGDCNGTATATVSGGASPYTYKWSTGATTSSVSGLCAGIYKIVVTDKNGCKDSTNVNITQPANGISVSTVQTNVTCNGNCNGSATATVIGGTPVYTYKWSTGATTSSISGLCAGIYKIVVKDSNGCKDSVNVTITQPTAILITPSQTNVNCNGNCDGTASATVSGGTPAYLYKWSNGATTTSISNLCPGVYKLVITDNNGCKDSVNVTITQPNPLNISITQTNVTCIGNCNGVATATVTGGTPIYTYKWNTGATTSSISGLCAGAYKVVVTDAHGCKDSANVNITQPLSALSVTTTNTNLTCNSICNGTATAIATGGTPAYTYKWSNGETTSTASGLCAGNYTVVVTDANGCKDSVTTITITQPPAIRDSITAITNLSCNGNDNGSATVGVKGGIPSYTYLWSPSGGNAATANSLTAGTYTVTITDSNGCTSSLSVTLTQPAPFTITFSQTNVTCNGDCNGTATANTIGGTLPYTYTWSNGQTNQTATGLCPGLYTVTVTDNAGCSSTATVNITSPAPLTATLATNKIFCNNSCDEIVIVNVSGGTLPYTYTFSNGTSNSTYYTDTVNNLCPGITYTITITDSNKCTFIDSILFANPPAITEIHSVIGSSCNSINDGSITVTVNGGIPVYTYLWSNGSTTQNLSNILSGTYTLTIKDSAGCSITDTINVPSNKTVISNAGRDTSLCPGTTITLNGDSSKNAVTYKWLVLPSLNTISDTSIVTVSPTVTTTYVLVASNGGCNDTSTITVTILPAIAVSAGPTQFINPGQSATIGGSPTGPNGSTYLWQPGSGLSDSIIANPVATPSVTTTYTVFVTNPNGCPASDTVTVFVVPQLVIPDGFTPNGDGQNDVWIIGYIDNFPGVVVEVYNRWGELLFRSVGYKNPWDGTYNGKPVPVGTYYYVINLHDPKFTQSYTGPVTILR